MGFIETPLPQPKEQKNTFSNFGKNLYIYWQGVVAVNRTLYCLLTRGVRSSKNKIPLAILFMVKGIYAFYFILSSIPAFKPFGASVYKLKRG